MSPPARLPWREAFWSNDHIPGHAPYSSAITIRDSSTPAPPTGQLVTSIASSIAGTYGGAVAASAVDRMPDLIDNVYQGAMHRGFLGGRANPNYRASLYSQTSLVPRSSPTTQLDRYRRNLPPTPPPPSAKKSATRTSKRPPGGYRYERDASNWMRPWPKSRKKKFRRYLRY